MFNLNLIDETFKWKIQIMMISNKIKQNYIDCIISKFNSIQCFAFFVYVYVYIYRINFINLNDLFSFK